MARSSYYFTSESVSEGHPDKVCDRISDEIVDLVYKEAKKTGTDPRAIRVAAETLATTNRVIIAGEVRVPPSLIKKNKHGEDVINPSRFKSAAKRAIKAIGYEQDGFNWNTAKIDVLLHFQSAHIAQGVDKASDNQGSEGAGDQGIMFGYAVNETPELMPIPIWTAHRLAERLAAVRRSGELDYLRPDGKTQVTVGYEGDVARTVDTVVLSTQHSPKVDTATLRAEVEETVIRPVVERTGLDAAGVKVLINPTGRFEIGGPQGDAGLTGRKVIIDTYGGASRHGGGAFSGKDPSKVDRSAAYAMRWVAKNAVAAGLADRLELQVAYAIGKAAPVGLYVETFGTAHVPEERIIGAIREVFDLRPAAIIRDLDLLRPIYAKTSTYGHFGRELPEFTWERTDRVDDLRSAARL